MEAAVDTARGVVRGNRQQRLAALLEVVGVFIGGTLAARLVSGALHLGPASLRTLDPGVQPDFTSLSGSAAANLLVRYGIVLALAFLIGRWHRGRRLPAYGVTTARRRIRDHIGVAILLFAATGILPLLVRLLPNIMPMGRAPTHWTLIEDLSAPGMWLYLFVGSFGLVPIAEELLARGYIQSRLAEDFGAPAAILITAVVFTFSHTQYFIASAIGIGMMVSLLIAALGLGYVRYRTGSVFPGIVAHALGNLPFRGWVAPAVLAIMVLVVALRARAVFGYAARLASDVLTREAIVAALSGFFVVAIVMALIFVAPGLLPAVALAALLGALALEFRERQRRVIRGALEGTGEQ